MFARGSSTTGWLNTRDTRLDTTCVKQHLPAQVPRSMRLKEPVKDYPLPQREQTMKVPCNVASKPRMTDVYRMYLLFF